VMLPTELQAIILTRTLSRIVDVMALLKAGRISRDDALDFIDAALRHARDIAALSEKS
jgi:hypothetical protein